jgi:hypothetical protein
MISVTAAAGYPAVPVTGGGQGANLPLGAGGRLAEEEQPAARIKQLPYQISGKKTMPPVLDSDSGPLYGHK